ncbi:beta-caryophyllene synthase, partial [Tanacetum coccineum]
MERGFLIQKGSRRGRGVKEKSSNASNIKIVMDGVVPYVTVESGNAAKEVVSPSMVDETVAKEKQSHLVNTSGLGSYPPLPIQETTSAVNAPGKSSYANVTGKPSGKKVNFRTLFTPGGNGIDVVVPVESIRAISERFINTAYGFFLGKRVAYHVVANYIRNTWDKYRLVRSMFSSSTRLFSFQFSSMEGLNAMLEIGPLFIRNNPLILRKWHPDVNLLKEDVGTVSVWVKLHGVPVTAFSEDGLSAIVTKLDTPLMLDSYTSDMCMQSWGRSSYVRAMIELRADVELKDNIVATMPKIIGEATILVIFVLSMSGNLLDVHVKNVESAKEVSKSNLFEVLTSVENDMELGTNGGTSNLASQATNSSGSSFWNVDDSSPSTTPIVEKIDKIEKLIIEGKVTLVDDEGKPLEKDGYGTQSLLEQWTESYENADYGYDPYDDMYEGQDIPDKLQAICYKLDITVRVEGRNTDEEGKQRRKRATEPAEMAKRVMAAAIEMDAVPTDLHFVKFPLMAQGHMVPLVDMARILAQRGATVTIITTPLLANRFRPV